MKKLLILMLVLGLTSAANAVIVGVSLRVAGPYNNPAYVPVQADYKDVTDISLTPSQYVWIGVYNPTKGATPTPGDQKDNFMLGTVEPSPDTSWTGLFQMYDGPPGNMGNDGISPGLGEPLVDGCPVNVHYGVFDFGGGLVLDVWSLQLTDGNPATFNDVGVLDAKQLHCDIEPSVDVVGLYNATTYALYDSVNIHNIPEPMTVLLLGLGGLLLRRRK